MSVYLTAITPASAQEHHHVNGVRWLDCSSGTSNQMPTAQAVKWLRDGNKLYVAGVAGPVEVGVVNATPPYLRTYANNTFTDNLLALPRYS